jgi:hypothetical protein
MPLRVEAEAGLTPATTRVAIEVSATRRAARTNWRRCGLEARVLADPGSKCADVWIRGLFMVPFFRFGS